MTTIGQSATANAGPTTVTYLTPILIGSKAENYELYVTPASGVLPVTINKADVSGVIFPVDATVEFGYDLRYAEFAINGVGDGTFAFENAKDIVPPAVDFYEYKVIFTPRDSRNYNTQEAMVSLEVVKCQLNYVVGIAGTTQVGQTLVAVTTGLPAELAGQTAYEMGRNGSDAEARFTSANTINTTAIKEGAVTAPYEATLTFWFYVEDASKLVGTTGEKGGAAKLEVYIGNSTKLWEERALFLDGNHFKAQLCYGQLVSGWNKISVSTSYNESLITSGKSLRIIITNGTGTDNTVKMMVANPQIEILEKAQSSRATVVATIPNATENA
jgi:hypothetical protein